MAGIVKKQAKPRHTFGTSMGVSSIIAILVILVLVVFSTLSLATSRADLKLSEKSSAGIKAFYEADSEAENRMAEAAAAIADGAGWQTALAQKGYDVTPVDGGSLIAYTVPVDKNRKLEVELFAGKNGDLTRLLWQVVPAKKWAPDERLDLYIP